MPPTSTNARTHEAFSTNQDSTARYNFPYLDWGMSVPCSFGTFQKVTGDPVAEIEAVIRNR
jgi:hypothetical protein